MTERRIIYRLCSAAKNCIRAPWRLVLIAAYLYGSYYLYSQLPGITGTEFEQTMQKILIPLFTGLWAMGAGYLLLIIGDLSEDLKCSHAFKLIGLDDCSGNTPILIEKLTRKRQIVYRFYCPGIPLPQWQDRLEQLESAMNIRISVISNERSPQEIYFTCTKGKFRFIEDISFFPADITEKNELILGRTNDYSKVSADLTVYPHFLIGGATGSGKTYLLKLLLYQCVFKKYQVIIADFKGGVDYAASLWKSKCDFVDTDEALLKKLDEILEELGRRKKMFFVENCKDIEAFNEKHPDAKLKRIVFACDELAELLDTTGLSKEEKEDKRRISHAIATIARLGRAFGIHLILATQRPDADIISGQIKNNISYRICGRADDVLSRIILDNTDAAKRIPSSIRGMFVNHEGTLFKGFLFDETRQ